jgi:hypothetical protein
MVFPLTPFWSLRLVSWREFWRGGEEGCDSDG